jgi:hypothetical protein
MEPEPPPLGPLAPAPLLLCSLLCAALLLLACTAPRSTTVMHSGRTVPSLTRSRATVSSRPRPAALDAGRCKRHNHPCCP